MYIFVSEPASGSVIPMQLTKSPEIIPGKYFCFNCSLPYLKYMVLTYIEQLVE